MQKKSKMAPVLILHLYLFKQMFCNNAAVPWRMGGISASLLSEGEAEGRSPVVLLSVQLPVVLLDSFSIPIHKKD